MKKFKGVFTVNGEQVELEITYNITKSGFIELVSVTDEAYAGDDITAMLDEPTLDAIYDACKAQLPDQKNVTPFDSRFPTADKVDEKSVVMTVYKYPIALSGTTEITVSENAALLKVDFQCDELMLWALVDTSHLQTKRTLVAHPTGKIILDFDTLDYIGTCSHSGGYVAHIFEVMK